MKATQIKYDEHTDRIEIVNEPFEVDESLMESVYEFENHEVREVLGWAPYTHLVVATSDSDPDFWMQVAYLVEGDPR